MSLVDNLIKDGWLKTDRIIEAFRKIKREDFVPAAPTGGEPRPLYGREDMKYLAELNEALPIGFGQTISQPLTVAFMLELLQPKEGDNILDVGSGSGWTTALLAHMVSQQGNSKSETLNSKQIKNSKSQIPNGRVIAIEVVPELKEFGEKNVSKYNFIEKGIVKCMLGDGSKGYESEAPYDKILVGATGHELPEAWKKQLKVGGRIVCPIENSIWLFVKTSEKDFKATEYPGFAFVPLINKQSKKND